MRVVGTSEYLMDENQLLSSFSYVLESLKNRRVPEFAITSKMQFQSDLEFYTVVWFQLNLPAVQ